MMPRRCAWRASLGRGLILGLFAAAAGLPPAPALADPAAAPKETVTEELIRLLAEHNALSKDDATKLIKRLQEEQAQAAAPPAPAGAPPPAAVAGAAPAGAEKARVRVIYVPESEKAKIREEVKQEVIAQAKAENWALPNAIPDWVHRISFDGDLRFRQEFDLQDSNNDTNFINFQTVNSGSPVNTNPAASQGLIFPFLNTNEDREASRVRARIGLTAAVADDLTAAFRFTTGNNTNPVSTNQTLGTDFNKMAFVIDRAYLDYRPLKSLEMWAGRLPNPWQSTELVWDEDLNFDGFAAQFRQPWSDSLVQRATVGVFSVENTSFDFPSTSGNKAASRDKWLFATQLGADWKVRDGLGVSGSVAYYYFYHLEGKAGNCSGTSPISASISCDSDDSRPGFIQKGNTLFALRNTQPAVATDPNYEYFGLASPFHVLDAVISVDSSLGGPLHLIYDFDYAYNLAYHKNAVNLLVPVNNYGGCPKGQTNCTTNYQGGNVAFLAQIRAGYPVIRERWQWNVLGGYRRIETDAVVDAFTDSDFHLGGTNAKGYYIGGSLGFEHNAWATARWLSATEVTGSPLAIDVFQLDLNARF